MTKLSDFTSEQQDLIIRLPYCVGMYVSQADNAQSEEETQQEMNALIRILEVLPNLYERTPLVQEVLNETHRRHEQWEEWSKLPFNIHEDCPRVVAYMKQKATLDELSAYSNAVHEIADTVARAVAEAGSFEIQQVPREGMLKILYEAMKAIGLASAQNSASVTAKERAAISEIDAAMKISD